MQTAKFASKSYGSIALENMPSFKVDTMHEDTIMDQVYDYESRFEIIPQGQSFSFSKGKLNGMDRELSMTRDGMSAILTACSIPQKFIMDEADEDMEHADSIISRRMERMMRTNNLVSIDNKIVGVVSDVFEPLLNSEVVNMVIDMGNKTIGKITNLDFSGPIMALSTKSDRIGTLQARVGDPVQGGVRIINSVGGKVAFTASGFLFRLKCTNGMVSSTEENVGRIAHRGSGMSEKAMLSIFQAMDSGIKYIQPIMNSVNYKLTPLEEKGVTAEIGDRFTHKLAEDIMSMAHTSKAKDGLNNEALSAYDVWNGITYAGTHSMSTVHSMHAVQKYAGEFILRFQDADKILS